MSGDEDDARGAQLRLLLPKPNPDHIPSLSPNLVSSRHSSTHRQTRCPACVPCQVAKNKCDGGQPQCSRCKKKGIDECTYRERNVRANRKRLELENAHLRRELQKRVPAIDIATKRKRQHKPASPISPTYLDGADGKGGPLRDRRLSSLSGSTVGEGIADATDVAEELQLCKKVLHGVFQAIRGQKTQKIFELVRDDATVDQIAAFLEQLDAKRRKPGAEELVIRRGAAAQALPLDNAANVEQPLQQMGIAAPDMDNSLNSYPVGLMTIPQSRHYSNQVLRANSFPIATANSSTNQLLTVPQSSASIAATTFTNSIALASDSSHVFPNSSIRCAVPNPLAFECLSQTKPAHLCIPLHEPCAILDSFSRLYTTFRDAANFLMGSGTPEASVLGPTKVTIDVLLRGRLESDQTSVCSWASSVARSFEESAFLVRLGYAFLIARLLRWILRPTAENYALLPPMMRPTQLQISKPHAPCVDLAIFPAWRDSLINHMRDFTKACTVGGVQVLWRYPAEHAVHRDPHTGEVGVTPEFAACVSDMRNWRLGRRLLEVFPESEGVLNLADESVLLREDPAVPSRIESLYVDAVA